MRPSLRRALSPSLCLLILTPLPVAGQSAVRTIALVVGRDTVAVEQVERASGRLTGDLLSRSVNQRVRYTATLDPDERITLLDSEFRLGNDDDAAPPRRRIRMTFLADSVLISLDGAAAPSQRLGTTAGALPYINPSFAMVEQALRRARRLGADSVIVPLFAVGGQTVPAVVRRLGTDSVVVNLGGAIARLSVAADGSILGGAVPSQGLSILVKAGPAGRALEKVVAEYTAPPGAPYRALPVTVPTTMGHTLAGTLTIPTEANGPVPAIVTITGSGLEDRDEAIPSVKGYRPFREIADALARRGIAVLRMDDRGFGSSGGNPASATSESFADDIRAGLDYLRTRSEIDRSRLGLVGHSEGGLIAPLIAATDSTLKGIVLMAGPAFTGRRILEFQNRYNVEHQASIPAAARDSALRAALRGIDSAAAVQPWLKFFLDYDPLTTARRVSVPVLILQGATDQQVTADQAQLLGEALKAGGNRDVTVEIFPATNHLFVADPDGSPAGYPALPTKSLRPEVLARLADWLARHLGR